MDIFTTLGDMLRPGNLPDIYPVKKLNTLPEPEYTWQCRRCDAECAGERGIGLCMTCETAVRRSKNDSDCHFVKELEQLDKFETRQNYDLQRDIERDIEDDRRRRDEDWQREYTHFPNF